MTPNDSAPAVAEAKPALLTFGRERPEPGAYYLDLKAVATFPLNNNGQLSNFSEIYRKLRERKILKMPDRFSMGEATYGTDVGEVTISGESGHGYISGLYDVLNLLHDLIDLHREGLNPYGARWFYFDHDWSRDADELFRFFVTYDGKIVRERFTVAPDEPRVLLPYKADAEPIWHSEPYEHQAWEAYWYRKFYTETPTGQFMVLRSDEPILYQYGRATPDVTKEIELVTLIKGYRLLWIVVALITAVAFPLLKPYMAVIAGAVFGDLLYRIWITRNVGRS